MDEFVNIGALDDFPDKEMVQVTVQGRTARYLPRR